MALRLKFDRLLSLRPDVAVVQECADPDGANGWRPDCAAYDWIGFNPDKGLGIFTFGDLTLTRHAWLFGNVRPLSAGDGVGLVSLQPAGLVGGGPAQGAGRRDQRSGRRAATLPQLPRRGAGGRGGRFQPAAPADVGAARRPRQLGGRCAGRRRPDQRGLRHERRLGPAGAAPDALPPAQVLARLRGRLHLHPSRRDRPTHRVRGGRSARLDHLERSCAAGRRIRSDSQLDISVRLARFRARSH